MKLNFNDVDEDRQRQSTEISNKGTKSMDNNNRDEDNLEVCEIRRINGWNVYEFVENIRKTMSEEVKKTDDVEAETPPPPPPYPSKPKKASKRKQERCENMFSGVLVPLPFVPFSLEAKYYLCTVCQGSSKMNLRQFELHREEKSHRKAYGRLFKENNYEHFPDGAYFTGDDHLCCFCHQKFSSLSELLDHMRTHSFPEKYVDDSRGEHCNICRMPVLTSLASHHTRHRRSVSVRETYPCVLCNQQVFRTQIRTHCARAHSDEYFQCRVRGCGQEFLYGNQMLRHLKKCHKHRENYLNNENCRLPEHVVRIECSSSSCRFHLLGRDKTAEMFEHFTNQHFCDKEGEASTMNSGRRMEYFCRICDHQGLSYYEVDDHAKRHLNGHKVISNFSIRKKSKGSRTM